MSPGHPWHISMLLTKGYKGRPLDVLCLLERRRLTTNATKGAVMAPSCPGTRNSPVLSPLQPAHLHSVLMSLGIFVSFSQNENIIWSQI